MKLFDYFDTLRIPTGTYHLNDGQLTFQKYTTLKKQGEQYWQADQDILLEGANAVEYITRRVYPNEIQKLPYEIT